MKVAATLLSSANPYLMGIPIAILVIATGYLAVVWMAICKKDEVEASAWYGNTGFSIKARTSRAFPAEGELHLGNSLMSPCTSSNSEPRNVAGLAPENST